MSAEGAWRVVDQDQDDLPTLVIRSRFNDDGYEIYLSDLSRIWTEKLNKDALIERAHELGCPIDPGDDAAQYKIFTKKLKAALDQESGTSLELHSARTGTTITLSLSVSLPKPLSALEWEVHLQKNDDLLYSHLTGPLINEAHLLQQRIAYLLGEIQAKDHVLSKLTDRLESSGTPWADVFPQIASMGSRSRATSLDKVAQHVRGLAPFEQHDWQHRVNSQPIDPWEHLSAVIGTLPSVSPSKTSIKPHWWGGLNVKIARSLTLSADPASVDRSSPPPEGDTTVVFETQPNETGPGSDGGNGSSTDDDEFQDHVPSSPARPKIKDGADELAHRPSKKIGTIGGRARKDASPPSEAPAQSKPSKAASPPPLPKPKAKLGTIGGKKTSRAETPEPEPEPIVETTEPATSAPATKTRKLGTIGGRKKGSPAEVQPAVRAGSENKSAEVKQQEARVNETPQEDDIPEEERADHKRDQLKRQLEQQAKAPVKKKRRF